MPKPVLLVHGAYSGAWEWEEVLEHLRGRGVTASAVNLTTRETGGTLARDEHLVREALSALDGPAVLVGHSYSGAVITAASAGNPDVGHLIYVAAALPQEGQSVVDARGGPPAKRIEGDDLTPIDPVGGPARLFNDASPEQSARAVPRLGSFTRNAFSEPVSACGWRDHPSTYVICSQDKSIAVELQERFAANTTDSVRLDAGHSPMITQPRALAEIIAAIVESRSSSHPAEPNTGRIDQEETVTSDTPTLGEVVEELKRTQERLQRLEDEREIANLLALYGYLVDLPLEEEWLDIMTEDAVMDARFAHGAYPDESRWQGREALREFINDPTGRRRPGSYLRTMHVPTNNLVIKVDGDEALANAYSFVILKDDEDGKYRVTTAGASHWKFRRVDGKWRIAQRSRREIADDTVQELLADTLP
ncbi:MAG: putative hydrolase or acyltransferase of alpha/beta superfamily [Cryobacterium sp.]|nr:putative hydrolase or acyltransferase of alpha/beta superfamily [Cryobacterium sp.]